MIHYINFRLILILILLVTTPYSKEVEITFRNMPAFPLLEYKKRNFCFFSYSKEKHFLNIKSYFYQAAAIELHEIQSLTKPKPWNEKCSYLVKTEINQDLVYSLEIFDQTMAVKYQQKKVLPDKSYLSVQKVLAEVFVPFLKRQKVVIELNHDVLKKAYMAYKDSRGNLSIEILNNLKTMLEQKNFQKPFTDLEYKVYKNTLFQIALYYESISQLNQALLYYQFSLRHDLKNKTIQSSIARVLQRQRDLPKLQKLFRNAK